MNKFDPGALASTMSIREYAEIQVMAGLSADTQMNASKVPITAEKIIKIWIENKQGGNE